MIFNVFYSTNETGENKAGNVAKKYGLFLTLTVLALLFVYYAITTENYLTWFNFKTIIRDAALVGIMAIGLTFVTISGNFFLLSMKETQREYALHCMIYLG